jgi:hypothetical protein
MDYAKARFKLEYKQYSLFFNCNLTESGYPEASLFGGCELCRVDLKMQLKLLRD